MKGAAVARIEMQLVARRQLGSSVGCGQSLVREPARKTHAGILVEVIVKVAVRFCRGRRGVVVCCVGSGLSRLGKHNGLVIDAVGMIDDPDAADKQRRGRGHRTLVALGRAMQRISGRVSGVSHEAGLCVYVACGIVRQLDLKAIRKIGKQLDSANRARNRFQLKCDKSLPCKSDLGGMFGIDLKRLMALSPTGLFGAAADREIEIIRYIALEPDLDSPDTRFIRKLGPLAVSVGLRPASIYAI